MTNRLVIKLLISLFLVLASFHLFDYKEAVKIISKAELELIFISFILVLLHLIFVCVRWKTVISGFGHEINLFELIKIILIGQFIKQIFPSQILSELSKIFLCAKAGIEISTGIISFLTDKLLGILTLFVLVLSIKFVFNVETSQINISQISVVTLIISILFSLLILGLSIIFAWLKIGKLSVTLNTFSKFELAFRKVSGKFKLSYLSILKLLIVSIISNFLIVLSVYVISVSLDVQMNFMQTLVYVPLALLISILPISFGGWGAREIVFIHVLSLNSISSSEAAAISMVYGLVITCSGLLGIFYVPSLLESQKLRLMIKS